MSYVVGRRRLEELPSLDRFLQFVDGDDLGMVLRSHLALEVALNMVIASSSPDGLGGIERLPFMSKVDVVVLLGKLPPDTRRSFVVAKQGSERLRSPSRCCHHGGSCRRVPRFL